MIGFAAALRQAIGRLARIGDPGRIRTCDLRIRSPRCADGRIPETLGNPGFSGPGKVGKGRTISEGARTKTVIVAAAVLTACAPTDDVVLSDPGPARHVERIVIDILDDEEMDLRLRLVGLPLTTMGFAAWWVALGTPCAGAIRRGSTAEMLALIEHEAKHCFEGHWHD